MIRRQMKNCIEFPVVNYLIVALFFSVNLVDSFLFNFCAICYIHGTTYEHLHKTLSHAHSLGITKYNRAYLLFMANVPVKCDMDQTHAGFLLTNKPCTHTHYKCNSS